MIGCALWGSTAPLPLWPSSQQVGVPCRRRSTRHVSAYTYVGVALDPCHPPLPPLHAGNIVFGYRRVLSTHDSLDANAVLGLRSVLSLTSTRQVTPYTSASASLTWTPQEGAGLQLSTNRQMPHNMQASGGGGAPTQWCSLAGLSMASASLAIATSPADQYHSHRMCLCLCQCLAQKVSLASPHLFLLRTHACR